MGVCHPDKDPRRCGTLTAGATLKNGESNSTPWVKWKYFSLPWKLAEQAERMGMLHCIYYMRPEEPSRMHWCKGNVMSNDYSCVSPLQSSLMIEQIVTH